MSTTQLGSLVYKFVCGTSGPLTFINFGKDWGISCGTYQFPLKNGECILFLKTEFPLYSRSLYYNKQPNDHPSKYAQLDIYSSSNAVKSVWMKIYNMVGVDKFKFAEYHYVKTHYYDILKEKLSNYFDLEKMDQVFQDCIWSWVIDKGVKEVFESIQNIFTDNSISSLSYIEKEDFLDMIYDYRYKKDPISRYEKGKASNISERELLRSYLTKGTFSGITIQEMENKKNEEERSIRKEELSKEKEYRKYIDRKIKTVKKCNGTLIVIITPPNTIFSYEEPDKRSKILNSYKYEDTFNIMGITNQEDFYLTDNKEYIPVDNFTKYVPESTELYKVRVQDESIPVYKNHNLNSNIIGELTKNQITSIIKEVNGFGLIQSKLGWINLRKGIKISK